MSLLATGPHTRPPFRVLRNVFAAFGLAAAATAFAHAGEPGASRLLSTPGSDVSLARAALVAVDADPVLRDANLVVSVVNRVAVVGGPVPTAEVKDRAEAVVRGVKGIADVRNRCFVQAGPDPLIGATARRDPTPRRPFPTDLPTVVPDSKPSVAAKVPVAPTDGAIALADTGEKRVVARRLPNPSENVLLGPVGVPSYGAAGTPAGAFSPVPPVATPLPPAVLTSVPPTATVPGRTSDVRTAAETVRRSDPRYAGLRVELRDGTLVIGGVSGRASDAWDLAQALRGVPGVARVAVGAVEVR